MAAIAFEDYPPQSFTETMDSRLFAAQRAWQRGDLVEALACLRQLARAPDASSEVFDVLARLCLQQGLLDEAASALESALALDPNAPDLWRRLGLINLRLQNTKSALVAFEHVVQLKPDSATALTDLGMALQRAGAPALAVGRHRQALAIDPGKAVAHSNLAAALATTGQFDLALEHAERAIKLNPRLISPYMHAAFLEADRERFDESLAWIGRIPGNIRQNASVITSHAEILVKANRNADAAAACDRAIALQPDFGDAHLCRGIALAGLGSEKEALEAFDRAATLMPYSAAPLARKAVMLLELARIPEAHSLFRKARTLEPRRPEILYMCAAAVEFRLDPDEVSDLEGLLMDENSLSAVDRINLHFTLANAYRNLDEVTKVFPHLDAGNRIKRQMVIHDPNAADEFFRAVATIFPVELFQATEGNPSDVPIFVVGVPRSGTTLVEQILASHPEIEGRGELRDMETVMRQLVTKYNKPFPYCIPCLNSKDMRAAGAEYLSLLGALPVGKRHIVDKMPANALYVGLIHLILPNARIILCRRDPLDTCFSCYSQLFTDRQAFSYDLLELGRYFRSHERLMAHWKLVLPKDRLLEINYEDVVADIEGSARELIAFCGLEWSDKCLRFYESDRPVRTASMQQVRKPLYSSSIGRWRPFREELQPLFTALGIPSDV